MVKKGYNWKSRQIKNTVIDNSTTQKIEIDFNVKGHYDQSNELVLPSNKRQTKTKNDKTKVVKILSKKHRKKLEKIVEKKKKKQNRSILLEALEKVQATPDELQKLTSIAAVQTKGIKRFLEEESKPKRDLQSQEEIKLNSIKGSKRRKLLENYNNKNDNIVNDPNVVGFDDYTSGEEDEEIDMKEEKDEVVETTEIKDEVKEADDPVEIETPQLERKPVNDYAAVGPPETKKIINEAAKKDEPPKKVKLKSKPAVFIDVIRDATIQENRLKLPILAEEQEIMETINENSIILIAGETGSGKTTQIPQFLYEAGYALNGKMIGITEPRRVAAISMSKRVGEELNLSQKVSYLIRFEGNVTEETQIKFMTDGVLLKEIQNDFLLTKYSVIILDEAHERSVYTDILIGLLSRIVPLRLKRKDPLKLIIMSATLRLKDFTSNSRLFKTAPPVIKVDTRQFPVTIHFNKRTNENYLKEAFSKIIKIHTKLPEGGILVFVTGQQEVNVLVKKLRKLFPLKHNKSRIKVDRKKKKKVQIIPKINLDDYSVPGAEENSDFEGDDEENLDEDYDLGIETLLKNSNQPLWVLPLYSMLPTHKQQRVFQPPPEGCRLCVISTNVAETSLTIPHIKYVVDTGKTKAKLYDKVTGVSSYVITWTSKASADQRAGRAGRLGPGHCYRLYSSAVFNDVFQQHTQPEIQQKPVDDLYLQMRCMNIEKIVNFPFPTAPDLLQLKTAEHRLKTLGALDDRNNVTDLGRAISKFPLLPRYGKMLALSHQFNLLPYTICLVAALSVQEVLLETPLGGGDCKQKWGAIRQQWAGHGHSLLLGDNMVLLKAVGAAEYSDNLDEFCRNYGLRHKGVVEIRKLRLQLTNEIKVNVDGDIVVDPKLPPPNDLQAKLLRQILLSGMGDQVARKVQLDEVGEDKAKFKYAYHANNMAQPVFLHSSSVLRKTLPEFVVYNEIYETNKIYMRGVTAIEPEWLPVYVPSLCQLEPPLTEPPPYFNQKDGRVHCTRVGSFGSQAWPLPNLDVEYPRTLDCFKLFAKFFLEGEVCDKLKKYRTVLISAPGIMMKSWAKLQVRTENLLTRLMIGNCATREELLNVWAKSDKKFLLDEYLLWLPESAKAEVVLKWPPI